MVLLDPVALQPDLAAIVSAAAADFVTLRGAPGKKPNAWAGTVVLSGAVCTLDPTTSGGISDWNYECRWKAQTEEEATATWDALETAVQLVIDPTWKVTEGSTVPDATVVAARLSVLRDDGVRVSAVHYHYSTGRSDVVLSVWSPR